jgi:Arc/MetJ-type ribon-helix-helix transcriptional regulator
MSHIVTISVSMPAEMQRLIVDRVKARFFGNISEYFRHLVRQDLEKPTGAGSPPMLTEALAMDTKQRPSGTAPVRKDALPPVRRLVKGVSRTDEISDAEVERLRSQYPVAKIEKLHAVASPRGDEQMRLARLLKVLRGEGTPKARFAWWDPTDLEFFNLLHFRLNLGGDSDEAGGARVRASRSPKPGSGSARARRPRPDEDR